MITCLLRCISYKVGVLHQSVFYCRLWKNRGLTMLALGLLVLFGIFCDVTATTQCTAYPCLIFEDNFDTFDLATWQHEITAGGGGNFEFQYYINNRTNSYVRDGILYIKPTLTSEKYGEDFLSSGVLDLWGHQQPNQCTGNAWSGCQRQGTATNYINPIQSARIRTSQSFGVKYGRIEVDAQMPSGDWIWPAIWMLPRYNEYGDWPASGEIDIVESRGNANYTNAQGNSLGNDHGGATLHWGPYFPENRYHLTAGWTTSNFAERMHKFTVDWNENGMQFYVNQDKILDVDPGEGGFWAKGGFNGTFPERSNPWVGGTKMAPFDKEFYIIINVAVGGTNGFFHDSIVNQPYPKPWSDSSRQAAKDFWNASSLWYPTWRPNENNGEHAALKVDRIRVYKMDGEIASTPAPSGTQAPRASLLLYLSTVVFIGFLNSLRGSF